jgi:ABC-type phosphate transport system substrate-binding protein
VRFFLLSLPLLWMILPEPLQAEGMLAVIVPDAPPIRDALSREELDRIYRRKKLFWESGARIIPVNLPATHPLRRSFSRLVFGALPEDMEAYWNAQYFHGISPPYVLASEEAVLQFIATTPGAIGYVNATAVNGHVQVLLYLPLASGEKRP